MLDKERRAGELLDLAAKLVLPTLDSHGSSDWFSSPRSAAAAG
jgi:hypothetical protein